MSLTAAETDTHHRPIFSPPRLPTSGTIALLSPSNRLNTLFRHRLDRTTTYLTNLGYTVTEIFTPIPASTSHLNSILHRASEIHTAFSNPSVKAILCTIGGQSCNELLPHLDYELIRQNPKILVGYSDVTILLLAMYTQAGVRGFYGPAAIPCFGPVEGPHAFTVNHFFGTLGGAKGLVPRAVRWERSEVDFRDWLDRASEAKASTMVEAEGWKWVCKGKGRSRGRLIGGCLPSLVQLGGSRYSPDYTGKVLLLELPEGYEFDRPYSLVMARSDLADLRNAGVLEKIVGVVVGRPFMFTDAMRGEWEELVQGAMYGIDVPVVMDVDIGHAQPVCTFGVGVMCELDAEGDRFEILESAVDVQ